MGKLNFIDTEIEGLFVIEPKVFADSRGFFMETYNQNDFKEMGINMIGIGPFLPAKGTPLEKYPAGSPELTLKAVAVTRLVCKRVFIPATTALASVDIKYQAKALMSGANTLMLVNTPAEYRNNYQIYSDKNMIDLKAAYDSIIEANKRFPSFLKVDWEVFKDDRNA